VLGWETGGGAASGRQAIEKRYEVEFASNPPKQSFKIVQVYAIGSEICAIFEFIHYQFVHHNLGAKGHTVSIFVREADDWKIRLAYAN
jgi:hypothetical protein